MILEIFTICMKSFTPLYKDTSTISIIKCAYCKASYKQEYAGQICDVCKNWENWWYFKWFKMLELWKKLK